MSPSEPAPSEVLALAVSIAIERRRRAAQTGVVTAGQATDEALADEALWRWGPEVGGWS